MLSRSQSRRDSSTGTATKAAIVIVFAVSVLILIGSSLFRAAMLPKWQEEDTIRKRVFAATSLVEITRMERYVGDRDYHIVTGVTQYGTETLVWINDSGHRELAAASGRSRSDIYELAAKDASRTIVRVSPAVWNGEYAWEVFYSKEDDSGKRFFYDFYKFSNGELLETYKLSKRPK